MIPITKILVIYPRGWKWAMIDLLTWACEHYPLNDVTAVLCIKYTNSISTPSSECAREMIIIIMVF